jgi:hypothetical protein
MAQLQRQYKEVSTQYATYATKWRGTCLYKQSSLKLGYILTLCKADVSQPAP